MGGGFMWWLFFGGLWGSSYNKKKWEETQDRVARVLGDFGEEFDDTLKSIEEQIRLLKSRNNDRDNYRAKTKYIVEKARGNSKTVDYTNDIIFCQDFLKKNYSKYRRNIDSIEPKLKLWSNTRLFVMRAIVIECLEENPDDRVLKNIRNEVVKALARNIYR